MKEEIIIGSPVTYFDGFKRENGIIKSFSPDGVTAFVVYHCDDKWDEYENYTGASTRIEDLAPGWHDQNGIPIPAPGEGQEHLNKRLESMIMRETEIIRVIQDHVLLLDIPLLEKALKDMKAAHSYRDSIAVLNPRPFIHNISQEREAVKIKQLQLIIDLGKNAREIISTGEKLGTAQANERLLTKMFS